MLQGPPTRMGSVGPMGWWQRQCVLCCSVHAATNACARKSANFSNNASNGRPPTTTSQYPVMENICPTNHAALGYIEWECLAEMQTCISTSLVVGSLHMLHVHGIHTRDAPGHAGSNGHTEEEEPQSRKGVCVGQIKIGLGGIQRRTK